MDNIILISIIAICSVLIAAIIIKRRPDLLVDFGLRACIGAAGIYVLDLFLRSKGYSINVGINVPTVLTNGFLGLPGFIMLYGLAAYYTFK